MIRILTIFFVLICFSMGCAPSGNQTEESGDTSSVAKEPTETYNWSRLTSNAGYSKTYNYQLFARDGKLYSFLPEGAWESSDGKNWSKTGLVDMLKNQAFLDYVEFNGAIYALGTFSGNISDHVLTSQIARTTDMKKWEILAKESNLPKRFLYHPFVFQNKIWIIGGNDGMTVYGDAWNSADGINWQKVADDLPFGTQHSQHFVVNDDKIYMLSSDVWVSGDGLTWQQVASKISSAKLSAYTPIVYDNKIWLLGNNLGGKSGSEVLYSENGATWKTQAAPWSPRGVVAACVFNDQLVITGGKYMGQDEVASEIQYVNDVWVMSRK